MDLADISQPLSLAGKVAGLAGLAIVFVLIIFREIVRKNIFPMLDRNRAFRILRLLIWLTAAIAIAGIVAWVAGERAKNQKPAIVANASPCTFNIKNDAKLGASISVGEITCSSAPNSTIRVTYYWLDGTSYASLSAGMPVKGLQPIVGASPMLMPTAAGLGFDALVKRFGERRDVAGDQQATFLANDSEMPRSGAESNGAQLEEADQDFLQYGADLPFYLPDAQAAATVYRTKSWPADYRRFYREAKHLDESDEFILASTTNWRPVKASEVTEYDKAARALAQVGANDPKSVEIIYFPSSADGDVTSALDELRESRNSDAEASGNEASADPAQAPEIVAAEPADAEARARNATEDMETAATALVKDARNNAVGASRYLTREGWPNDFLTAYGIWEAHADGLLGWSTIVLPRRPFMLVAVLDVVGPPGGRLKLGALSMIVDRTTKLRPPSYGAQGRDREVFELPDLALATGDKIVVPLRMELRATHFYGDVGREDLLVSLRPSDEVYRHLKKLLNGRSEDVQWGTIRKAASQFGVPESPDVQPAYTHGPTYEVVSARVNGADVPMRRFDGRVLFTRRSFEGGSCPTLLVRRQSPGDMRIGHVLVAASGLARKAEDVVAVGNGITNIVLREEELETSYIDRIEVVRPTDKKVVLRTGPFTLRYGEEVVVPVPSRAQGSNLEVRIRGYYEPQVSSARRNRPRTPARS